MDPNLVSSQEHENEYLARKHGTTVEKVRAIIAQTKSRSRREIEKRSISTSSITRWGPTRSTRSSFRRTATGLQHRSIAIPSLDDPDGRIEPKAATGV